MRRPGLDMLASLDPTGLAPRAVGIAKRLLPTAHDADVRDPESQAEPDLDGGAVPTPAEAMNELLQRSMFQTPAESLEALAGAVLQQIVPDEARILSALSDGSAYPLMHVEVGGRSRALRRVVANVSSVGRAAGVALPGRTHTYIHHLFQLGLVEEGPEDPDLRDEYSILTTDGVVREAFEDAGRSGLRTQRLVKRTLRMSALGRALWEVWRPSH